MTTDLPCTRRSPAVTSVDLPVSTAWRRHCFNRVDSPPSEMTWWPMFRFFLLYPIIYRMIALQFVSLSQLDRVKKIEKQSVALMGRNTTGPPCSVGRAGRPPAALQTPTDASERNNTSPLGGPVKTVKLINTLLQRYILLSLQSRM